MLTIIYRGVNVICNPGHWSYFAVQAIRPLICISVFFVVRYLHDHTLQKARMQAMDVAIVIQQTCNKNQTCPLHPPDVAHFHWMDAENCWVALLGFEFSKLYRIKCRLNDQTFSITFRINIDEIFEVSGGVGRPFAVFRGPYSDKNKRTFDSEGHLAGYVSELNRGVRFFEESVP